MSTVRCASSRKQSESERSNTREDRRSRRCVREGTWGSRSRRGRSADLDPPARRYLAVDRATIPQRAPSRSRDRRPLSGPRIEFASAAQTASSWQAAAYRRLGDCTPSSLRGRCGSALLRLTPLRRTDTGGYAGPCAAPAKRSNYDQRVRKQLLETLYTSIRKAVLLACGRTCHFLRPRRS